MELSDEGREFGTVVKWIEQKGFGYIARKINGEEYVSHPPRTISLILKCVSRLTNAGKQGTRSCPRLQRSHPP